MEDQDYRYNSHSVSACRYHFVWTPKYRHSILDQVEEQLSKLLSTTSMKFNHEIISLEILSDHVHLFVESNPQYSPSEIVKQFKGYSGKRLLSENPELREEYFWNSGFWKVGYFVSTAGKVSEEVIQDYINRSKHA